MEAFWQFDLESVSHGTLNSTADFGVIGLQFLALSSTHIK